MTSPPPTPERATPRWRKAGGRLLALVARPVRRAQGTGGTVIEAYRGYGSSKEIFLIGRVFRQARRDPDLKADDIAADLRDIARRIRRRKVADASVVARFGGAETTAVTDRDGYFRVSLKPPNVPTGEDYWHVVDLELAADPPVRAQGAGVHSAGEVPLRRHQRYRRHDHAYGRGQQAEDAVASVRGRCGRPRRLPGCGVPEPGAACGRHRRSVEPDALRLSRPLGHLRHAERILPAARDSGGAGAVPAGMGPVLAPSAAAPRRGPQARPDPPHAGALRRPAFRPHRR